MIFFVRQLIMLCLVSPVVAGTMHHCVDYMFPMPGSTQLSPTTSIILRLSPDLCGDPYSIIQRVCGSRSGMHGGINRFDVKSRILSFHPDAAFLPGENVSVQVVLGAASADRICYSFTIASGILGRDAFLSLKNRYTQPLLQKEVIDKVGKVTTINGVTVPSDFPVIKIKKTGVTAPGRIFFASTYTDLGNYLVICNEDGTPYFYRRYDSLGYGSGDFKVQPSGVLSAFMYQPAHHIILDHNYAEIDTFSCGHGYQTDSHECQLLPNGHALLVGLDPQMVDMSAQINGGKTNATVMGNHLQEVDDRGNVYFEWRSWDHYRIVDAINEGLKLDYIDYVHLNSIAVDYDGNYVISCRNLSEVTKINSTTGDIIWRLGGVNNQFDFINDEFRISYQHDCRPVPGKPDHYTVFDNGNARLPYFSRAVEWKIDTARMTVEKVWEFRYHPDRQCFMGGSVQRLPNGNTFIDWSMWPPLHNCEVSPGGDIVFEMDAEGTSTYRSHRYEWEGMLLTPYLIVEPQYDRLVLIFNKFGDDNISHYNIYGDIHPEPTRLLTASATTVAELTNLQNNTTWYFRVTAVDSNGVESGFSNPVAVPVRFTQPDDNLLRNGDFSEGGTGWNFLVHDEALAQDSLINGEFCIDIAEGGSEYRQIQLVQENLPVIFGHKYIWKFDAWAAGNRLIEPMIVKNDGKGINYSETNPMMISRRKQCYEFEFKMKKATDYNAIIEFNCGKSNIDVYFDNISLREIVDSDVDSPSDNMVHGFKLYQNYPNPFNPITTMNYELPGRCDVDIRIFNTTGQLVTELYHGPQDAGFHSVEFDGTAMSAGIYFFRLQASSLDSRTVLTDVKKMVLVR
jgi:hypothetical protein